MNFLRLVLWAFIGWLLYLFIRRLMTNSSPGQNKPRPPAVEHMVRCKLCGLHIPQQEAIHANNQVYCCDDHRRRDQAAQ